VHLFPTRLRPSFAARSGLLASLLVCALLSACGGGGTESGPADEVLASPNAVTVGTSGVCVVGLGPTIHVYGGQPPYKLSNSVPQGMQLSKQRLRFSGDSFSITFTNGVCMVSMPITIEDDMGRLTQVLISNGA
jgi:hypothetical protein